MHCHGSVQRSAGLPVGISSTYSLDGEEAHELLEYALSAGHTSATEAKRQAGDVIKWEHRKDTEEDRLESVQDALDTVYNLFDQYDTDETLVLLECRFTFPTTDNDDAGGTADVVIYCPALDIMVVADFKHGVGNVVNAEGNEQLLFYAVGARSELVKRGYTLSGRTLYRLIIMQPRAFHPAGKTREWLVNDQMLDAFIGEANFAIKKAKDHSPAIVPGPYCRWCPAFTVCPEAEKHRMQGLTIEYNDPNSLKNGMPIAANLSVERLAQILDMRDMVVEWLDQVEEQAKNLAHQGVAIPGRKLVYAQAKSKWHGEPATIAAYLADMSGLPVGVYFKPKLVTITEAKDIVKKEIYRRVGKSKSKPHVQAANKFIAELTIRDTSGNTVLARIDDKRPAINPLAQIEYNDPEEE